LQTVSNDRTYISPSILAFHKLEHKEYHPFFIKPKTLTSLAVLLGILNLLARSEILSEASQRLTMSPKNVIGSIKSRGAVVGTVFAFVFFGSIHLPDTIMIRPHPIFWRCVLALFTLYAMFMTYLFLLPVDEVRSTFRYFDTKLGKPLPEMSYADDCRVYTPENPNSKFANLYMAIFDVHFFAHFAGWFGKMLIMRDWWVAWICSAGFEFLELTFRYWLPNFYECWWDSLLLDLFGCNFLGILAGAWFLKYFGVRKISWVKSHEKRTKVTQTDEPCSNVILRTIEKFRPAALEQYEWSALQDLNRYIGVSVFVSTCLLIDCNNFFYKFLVWIPPNHDLLKYRVTLWGFVAIATSKEWYEYVSNPHCHRLGPFAWLTFYVCLIELSSIYKFTVETG